jgi:predicted dehydrogenase
VRYAVVGLGNIGQRRVQLLGENAVATVDPVNESADYRCVDELPDDVYEAVILATPNDVKIELMRRFLSVGKNVLVEKPLVFPDRCAAEDMQTLAKRTDTSWYTSYNHRYEPQIARLKARLAEGALGDFYHGRFVYGNGTAQNIAGTWRDVGPGVIEDLGCHLVDLANQLPGLECDQFVLISAQGDETSSVDHCVFVSEDRRISFECAATMWKNAFSIDLYGSLGSLHLDGLRKWGPVTLIERTRVYPSGVPSEHVTEDAGEDESWAEDIREFENMVRRGENSATNDRLISDAVISLGSEINSPGRGRSHT